MKNKILGQNAMKYHFAGALACIFIVSILTCFLYNKTMPTSEGWYSYYAKCIQNGQVVYSDFEYLFTPIYMYLIAGFIHIFGYNMIALRILGILVFACLALIIYLTLIHVFSTTASVIGTVTGIFYLQSEVYTVFYDYVRIMDIFASLSALFMVLTLLSWQNEKKCSKNAVLWGVSTSIFFLIKQNMGGLFFVYSILLILLCCFYFSWNAKKTFCNLFKYCSGFLIPVLIMAMIALKTGIARDMIDSIFFGAMEAKGGIATILFKWIENGFTSFMQVSLLGIIFVIVLIINSIISKAYYSKVSNKILFSIYTVIISMGVFLICFKKNIGIYFSNMRRLDVTVIFMATVFLLIVLFAAALFNTINKKPIDKKLILLIGLLGTYFTLSYGAGMSGGLSIGESALGLAVIICILFDSFDFKFGNVFKYLLMFYCVYLSFGCISFKLVNPCQWWGIDESSVYDSTESTDIPLLKGLKLSKSTKEMYENIVDVVDKKTAKNDPIFCFPHIPIFNLLCDRPDPGVYAKIQWFDVSTKESLKKDTKTLLNNLPSAIVIYNLFDSTYEGHENGFDAGHKSETRKMRDSLYSIVNEYNYSYEGTFISENNNISVYIKNNNKVLNKEIFNEGKGTSDDPYIIDTNKKLVNLAMSVNQGYDFDNCYFKQTQDLDLSDLIWVPAGYNGNNFNGNYDTEGYGIENINSSEINSNTPFGNEVFK